MAPLDFTTALYLGFDHAWRDLTRWERLTLGKPAALESLSGSADAERELASLTGCERAILAPSTLHLFWDLFGILARRGVHIFLDAGLYPIARWGVERAASSGTPVQIFRQHDYKALRFLLRHSFGRRPVVVADGYCPGRGAAAPVAKYLECVRAAGGLLVIDDTQALGIFGHSQSKADPYGKAGGGSLRRAGICGSEVILVSSMTKAFGVPVAMLAASEAICAGFALRSLTRVHCSPPSAAVIAAAGHALTVNRLYGDALRRQLAQRVKYFRQRLRELNMIATDEIFPVQQLKLPETIDAAALHESLAAKKVQTVLHRNGNEAAARISFIITARHTQDDIDRAVNSLTDAMSNRPRRQKKRSETEMTMQLMIRAEPFGAYSEPTGELESEFGRGARSSRTMNQGGGRFRGNQFRSSANNRARFPNQKVGGTHWSSQSAYRSPYNTNIGGWKSRWRLNRGLYGYSLPVTDPESVGRAQQCLRQLVGTWVPQTGRIGPGMRRALRIFQKQQQLSVTGLLDGATDAALRAACGGQRSYVAVAPVPAEDNGPPETVADDDGASSEPAGADQSPPESDDSEIRSAGSEQEFLVTSDCTVTIKRSVPVPVVDGARVLQVPRVPGVYIIFSNGVPWYVGIGERTVHQRFQDRMKALSDFNIPHSALANRTVAWVTVSFKSLSNCSIGRRERQDTSGAFKPLKGESAVLKVLEQYFIKTLQTEGKGNKRRESVRFAPGGSITLRESGKPDLKLSGASLWHGVVKRK